MDGSKPPPAQLATATADIALALGRDSTLSLTGTAAVAKLLPPELAALTGDSVPVEARATLREDGALAIDALTLGLPAGRLDADAVIGRPDREIAAHVAVSLSDLAAASALLGQPLQGAAVLSVTVSGTEDRPRVRIEASGGSLRIGGTGSGAGTGAGGGVVEREAGRSGGAAADRGGRGVARHCAARGRAAQSRPRSSLVAVGQRQTRFQPRRAGRFHRARRRDRYRRNAAGSRSAGARSTERCVWSSPSWARSPELSDTGSAAG